jgi:glutathione-regulated potassium-efflux system ancillary protein KefG
MKSILVLFFHPRFEESKVNKALVKTIATSSHVTFRDLYELYPDFNIDVHQEQQLLSEHDIIIWHHPFYWYSCPPLMKQWIDLVLEYGWAYGKNGDKLTGKYIMNVLSSGGNFEVYQKDGRNRFTYRELLSPFDQTAYLCQMHYLPPFIIPGANRINNEALEEYAIKYLEILNFLKADNIDVEKLKAVAHFNDLNFNQWETQFYIMP